MTPQGKEFTSLLFNTPRNGDAQKQVMDYRSPRPQHSPSTPLYGSRSGALRDRDGPPRRRRSLTPTGSVSRDTPPPPPTDSLMDSPAAGPGSIFGGWSATTTPLALQGPPGGPDSQHPFGETLAEPSASGTSTPHGTRARSGALTHQPSGAPGGLSTSLSTAARPGGGGDAAAQPGAAGEAEDAWVTVFGFGANDLPLVLREFQKCGDILQFGTFGQGTQVNWTHLQFRNKYAAQRALLKNGSLLSNSVMLGVKPLDPAHRQGVSAFMAGPDSPAPQLLAAPRQPPARPYRLDASASQGSLLPQPAKSTWAKVNEFVFGL